MLTKRIIACLDCNAGRVVKGVNFVNLRDAGDPAELALKHAESGADEIVLLDITATHEGRKTMFETVRRTARSLFVPLTVGGGVRTLNDAGAVFEAGCDKISINSAAVKDPALITCIAERFGSQAVIVAIDAKREPPDSISDGAPHLPSVGECGSSESDPEKKFRAYVAGGRTPTERYVLEWAREAESRGAGEILLTSMDRDGTGIGFDCELTAAVAKAVSIPVIASGGAGGAQHFVEVFQQGYADAALAASIFHFGINDIGELKLALRASDIPVRWPC